MAFVDDKFLVYYFIPVHDSQCAEGDGFGYGITSDGSSSPFDEIFCIVNACQIVTNPLLVKDDGLSCGLQGLEMVGYPGDRPFRGGIDFHKDTSPAGKGVVGAVA